MSHLPLKVILSAVEAPAGGATMRELLSAGIVAATGIALVAWFTRLERRSERGVLHRVGSWAASVSGLPVWAALPAALGGLSMLTACFGYYWDVATHIDIGRDPGPFGNPSHYFVLFGLLGITAAGFISGLLGERHPPPRAIRLGRLRLPIGGFLMLLCGVFALSGFPLDDLWHRLFGQDVTVWGPTHIQMIAGASVPTLGAWVLLVEASRSDGLKDRARRVISRAEPWLAGAFLIGLSALQSEFDHGVPQFRLLYQPVLLMLAAGAGLVAARMRLGRWGALQAVAVFVLIRGVVTLVVSQGFGHVVGHFPLYVAEALVVEVVAAAVPPARPLRFALLAGAGLGTVGLAAEWWWSRVWMPIAWPAELLPEAAVLGLAAAVGGSVLGAAIAVAMEGRVLRLYPRAAVAAGLAVSAIVLAVPLPIDTTADVRAEVSLEGVATDPGRTAVVRVALDPPDAAEDAVWFHALAYQGWSDGHQISRLVPMRRVGRGTFVTTERIPLGGDWKTMIRLHRANELLALPLFLPRDAGIPAPEVPAPSRFERGFVSDRDIVRREATQTGGVLQGTAYAAIAVIAALWLAAMVWALARLARSGNEPLPSPGRESSEQGSAGGGGRPVRRSTHGSALRRLQEGALRGVPPAPGTLRSSFVLRRVLDQGHHPGGHEPTGPDDLACPGHLVDLDHTPGGRDLDPPSGLGGHDLVGLHAVADVDGDLDAIALHRRNPTPGTRPRAPVRWPPAAPSAATT